MFDNTPLKKPPHLTEASPHTAMIQYHKALAEKISQTLDDMMKFDMEFANVFSLRLSPEQWLADLQTYTWEDGSIKAVLRDQLTFHKRCIGFLTNG